MIISKKHKKLVLNLRDPERITTIIPSARAMQYKGKTLVAIPHKIDETRVLRNLGIDAPAPMGYYYDWPGRYKPFIHQKTTSEFLTLNTRAFVLNGMGSGKTVSVLWAFDYLKKLGLVKRMLVISPLSTLERAWGDEIFRHFPELTFAVLHGDRAKRHQLLATDFDIYIINHDGFKNDQTVKLLNAREGLDLVVIDEVASFRNSSTDRWKALNALVNGKQETRHTTNKEWVWGLDRHADTQRPHGRLGTGQAHQPHQRAGLLRAVQGHRDETGRAIRLDHARVGTGHGESRHATCGALQPRGMCGPATNHLRHPADHADPGAEAGLR